MDKEAQEKMAELAHLIWQGWMAYMLVRLEDRSSVARWKRLANAAYCDLSEPEKESGRAAALRYIALFEELGYRKLPKDKPPLLSDEEIKHSVQALHNNSFPHLNDTFEEWQAIAQAQREADIKYYETLLSR